MRAAADSSKDEMFVTFDGQTGFPFGLEDVVIVTRAERRLRLVGSPTRGYYDTLRQKLHWGDGDTCNAQCTMHDATMHTGCGRSSWSMFQWSACALCILHSSSYLLLKYST